MIKNNIYINEPICNDKNRDQIKPISTSTLISNKKQQQFSKCAKLATNNKVSARRIVKQPQSIRLQIEVPIQMSNMSEDEESGDDMKNNVSILNNMNFYCCVLWSRSILPRLWLQLVQMLGSAS